MKRLITLLLTCALATPSVARDQRGDVYLETNELWVHTGGTYASASGLAGSLLIYKYVPVATSEGHFLIPTAMPLEPTYYPPVIFHYRRTVSAWDGSPTYYELPGKGYDEIFTDDAELTEIAPMRAGHFLVAERSSDRTRGAKLIEFTVQGRVAEYRFPELVVNDKALGAMHIEVLADQCTILYTLGNDDPRGNRVRRMNICTGQAESDFAPLIAGEYAGSIRQMANGDVIVANGFAILRFNSNGSLLRLYGFPGVTHVALTSDGDAFWAAGADGGVPQLRSFGDGSSIRIGNPEMRPPASADEVSDLVVTGEWRSAVAGPPRRRVAH